MRTPHLRTQAGFSLVEALVALVIMAFGMLALTSLQLSLSRNADVSKQRTEAMRLAQDRLEQLRSFDGIATGTQTWNALAGGSETVSSYTVGGNSNATNTSFTVTWTLGGTSADAFRTVQVSVAWADRASTTNNQSVSLSSVLSKSDPSYIGYLNFPLPQNVNIKRPKNRNLNIPIQAVDLGGGESAYSLANNLHVVFSDISGGVLKTCTGLTTGTTNSVSGCTTKTGYIIAGYVSGDISTLGSTPTMPTGINTNSITGTNATVQCVYEQAKNTTTGNAISGYHYYLCILPVDTANGGAFSGTLRLGGVPITANNKVCRVQYDMSQYVSTAERNVQPYSFVRMSLDNQNYVIDNSNNNTCPTLVSATGVSGGSITTVIHQNCRSSVANASALTAGGDCPASLYNKGL